MSNSFLLILKSRTLISMSISKLIVFNDANLAYEFALNLPYTKDKINDLNESLNSSLIWKSSKNLFPIYECKIIPVDNDILWNIYQTVPENEKLIPYVYKELFINEIINE